jgi:PilZ domain
MGSGTTFMTLTQQSVRRTLRYPLQLPVSLKLGDQRISARSENISLGGVLVSSDCVIPVGSTVEVEVGVAQLPDPKMLLTARGKVLRLNPTINGNFVVAIECDRAFEFMRRKS